MKKIIQIGFLVFLFGITNNIFSQEIIEIGFWEENGVSAIGTKNDYMFLGSGSVIDISSPEDPQLVANIGSMFGTSVKMDDNYAYYGTGMLVKLIVADISDPGNSHQVGSLTLFESGSGIFGIDVKDTILIAAAGSHGVYSISIANKENPYVLHSQIFGPQARDVAIDGELIYVAESDRFSVVWMEQPDEFIYVIERPGNYYSIDYHDDLIFLGKGGGGFDTYSINDDWITYFEFGTAATGGTAWDLKYHNGHIYLSTDYGGLQIFQLNENSATLKATYEPNHGQAFGLALQDSLVMLTGLIDGVSILQYDSLSVGFEEVTNKLDFLVYPNPANEQVFISGMNTELNTTFEIWSLNGVLIETIEAEKSKEILSIDVSNLESGSYLLKAKNGKSFSSQKLIINN